jgi:hypothetical protein|tara:strand:- start:89 stop:274 length:186 start_codon:yes stop_codon:yes gene_type:complete
MKELQILFQLEKAYGKVMTLEQALEAMGRVIFTVEELTQEGHSFSEEELILEIGDLLINEN